jgi:hypothetical protein
MLANPDGPVDNGTVGFANALIEADGLRRFSLVSPVRDSLRDNQIHPLSSRWRHFYAASTTLNEVVFQTLQGSRLQLRRRGAGTPQRFVEGLGGLIGAASTNSVLLPDDSGGSGPNMLSAIVHNCERRVQYWVWG